MAVDYVSDYEEVTGQKIPETPAEPGVIGTVKEPQTKVVAAPAKAKPKTQKTAEAK